MFGKNKEPSNPLDEMMKRILSAIEDADITMIEVTPTGPQVPANLPPELRDMLTRYTSDQHAELDQAQIEEDHARMRALESSVSRTWDTDFDDLTDGDKLRQVAYRLLFYISQMLPNRCVHDFPVAWELLPIADRLDLADISEGTARP